jgi:hypothetical protein
MLAINEATRRSSHELYSMHSCDDIVQSMDVSWLLQLYNIPLCMVIAALSPPRRTWPLTFLQ